MVSIFAVCASTAIFAKQCTKKAKKVQKTSQSKGSTMEKTFAIIKPDAVKGHHTGEIIKIIEKHGFNIIRMEKIQMSKDKAKIFYAEHSERPFFGELVDFITSGPVVVLALEKENGVKAWRDLMGATDPKKADAGTIRNMFGANIGNNAVHGSDAHGSARRELDIFFPGLN